MTPLYRYLGGVGANLLPVPLMNILNGGAHADNSVDPCKIHDRPLRRNQVLEALRMGAEVFHTLKGVLKKRGYSTSVGDEGGFAPNLKSNEEALDVVVEAITKAGYKPGAQISIALDPAASEFYDSENGKYVFKKSDKSQRTSEQMVKFWAKWVEQYPIISIEDGMAEDDWDGWKAMTEVLGKKIQLVGDDLFVTNTGSVCPRASKRESPIRFSSKSTRLVRSPKRSKPCKWPPPRATPTSCRTAPGKPKTRSSQTWWWPPAPGRSKPVRPVEPIA